MCTWHTNEEQVCKIVFEADEQTQLMHVTLKSKQISCLVISANLRKTFEKSNCFKNFSERVFISIKIH